MKRSRRGSTRVDAVDALAVVALGGAFAGVMTGNLVFLGAALGSTGLPEGVAAPAAAVGGYVCGTACAAPALRARWGGPLRSARRRDGGARGGRR
ncbi:DUF1275 family protein, partial [Streptomyces sp. SPB78]|uniref:DUF1275 family protein n=1 Tax=Streptomyces sp. (strain SPB78) TaxID=591157 RepID=UPI0001B54881